MSPKRIRFVLPAYWYYRFIAGGLATKRPQFRQKASLAMKKSRVGQLSRLRWLRPIRLPRMRVIRC